MDNAGLRFGLVACLLAIATGHALAEADAAAALLGQHTRLNAPLLDNPFGRPLVLDSLETSNGLQGDIYAVVAHSFNTVRAGLRVYIGKKTPQTLAQATQVDFQYKETAATPSYFSTTLKAKTGPLGTSDYLIRLEAIALSKTTSFLHLTYAYGVGVARRMTMQAYLSTLDSDKVGFTLIDQRDGGKPDFVAGVRGVVERYPRQLHEVDRPAYLEMKRAEVKRQHAEL